MGNLISNVTATITNTYRWDARHELVEWQEVSATQTNKSQWSYNGFGQRVQEISYTNGVAVTTNKFLWAGGTQPVEQRDASGATVLKRYYGQGMQIVSGSDAGTYFYQRDHLGSVRTMTDSTGNLRGVWDYDPFGRVSNNLVTSNAVDSDFKFTGHFYHEKSTLHLTLYRAYDADTGRWISRDPIAEAGGINLYGYVSNNPVNWVDPLGLEILLETHPVAVRNNHSKITIIPVNQAAYANDPRFSNTLPDGRRYATLGAGPEGGNLVSNPNRPRDINRDHNNSSSPLNPADCGDGSRSEDKIIEDLFKSDGAYDDKFDYELIPNRFSNGYNSNGYVNGLLNAVGFSPLAPSGTPGFTKPVPAKSLGKP